MRRAACAIALTLALTACLPIPHSHTTQAGAEIAVVDSAGRPLTGAVIHGYAGLIIGGTVYHVDQVPVDSVGKAILRKRNDFHPFLMLVPDGEAPYVFGWCAEAPGHVARGGVLEDEDRQHVTTSLSSSGSATTCPERLLFHELESGRLVTPRR